MSRQLSLFLGADPGKKGAVACINEYGKYVGHVRGDGTYRDQLEAMDEWADDVLFTILERVHSMPKQGVASSFKFGVSYGILQGFIIALELRHELITPQQWQKEMKCLTKGNKNVTKAKAQQLFPDVKVTHIVADALLLAEYARRLAIERKLLTRRTK